MGGAGLYRRSAGAKEVGEVLSPDLPELSAQRVALRANTKKPAVKDCRLSKVLTTNKNLLGAGRRDVAGQLPPAPTVMHPGIGHAQALVEGAAALVVLLVQQAGEHGSAVMHAHGDVGGFVEVEAKRGIRPLP